MQETYARPPTESERKGLLRRDFWVVDLATNEIEETPPRAPPTASKHVSVWRKATP
jgi:hypothetical protein